MAGPVFREFPYWRAPPAGLSAWGWAAALGGCVAGFAALVLLAGAPGSPWGLAGPLLFVLAPLIGLVLAAGPGWTALFPRPTARDLLTGLAFAPLALLVSAAAAFAFSLSGPAAANPAAAMLPGLTPVERTIFLAGTAPQLLGEELVTVVPLLAVLALLRGRLGLPRGAALVLAWIASAAVFGALHLSTYGWNLGQALLVIGASRMVLTIPYLLNRSVWSSFAAHITLDWSIFALVLLGAARG